MNRNANTFVGFVTIAFTMILLHGCATEPVQLQSVVNARSAYQQVAQDKEVSENAPVAQYEAEQALQKLNEAIANDADEAEIDHLAYLVQQRVAIAKEKARQKMAAGEIDQLNKERAQIRLELRQAEVLRAQQRAEQSALEATQATKKASALEQELQNITVHEESRGTVLTLSDIFFDFNKATLKPGAVQNLSGLVQFLKDEPRRNIVIEGYTDSIGPASYNRNLSYERARAVINYLAKQGINRSRLTVRGYGESFPVASNETPAGRQLNRRVEVVVLRDGQQILTPSGSQRPPRQQAASGEQVRFSELDRDKNGYLTKKEAQKLRSLSNNFERYDQNRDQHLDRSEFSAFEEMEIQQQHRQK